VLEYYGYKNANQYISNALEYRIIPNRNELSNISFIKKKMSDIVISPLKNNVILKTVISSTNAWKINKISLDNEIIFIAIVDVYYIPYRREYEKIHGAHAVIVTGYDSYSDVVNIIDCYEPYFYDGTITLVNFLRARSSKNPKDDNPYSGWQISNKWVDIYDGFNALSSEMCILKNINDMLVSKTSTREELCGIDALNYLLSIINHPVGQEFWRDLHNDMFPLSCMFNLFLCNYMELSDNMNIFRSEYVAFFDDYYKKFQELLFMMLKQSIRINDSISLRFRILLEHFIVLTKQLYDIFEQIIYSTPQTSI
jgi:hypothetical protein